MSFISNEFLTSSNQSPRILRVDASARYDCSVSRQLTNYIVERFTSEFEDTTVVERDVAAGLPFVTDEMIGAYYTPREDLTDDQAILLATSDKLVEELQTSDVLVLGVPIYNFSVPATLKAYIDLVARAGVTFRYGENGPVGLLKDRKTYVVVTSGGTPLGSDFDYVSGYTRHVLAFLGITDIEFIAADQLVNDPEATIAKARQQIDESIEQLAVAV